MASNWNSENGGGGVFIECFVAILMELGVSFVLHFFSWVKYIYVFKLNLTFEMESRMYNPSKKWMYVDVVGAV